MLHFWSGGLYDKVRRQGDESLSHELAFGYWNDSVHNLIDHLMHHGHRLKQYTDRSADERLLPIYHSGDVSPNKEPIGELTAQVRVYL